MRLLRLAVILALATGCATEAKYGAHVGTWQGKSSDDLVRAWGQPNALEKISSGDRMYLYSRLTHPPYSASEQVASSSSDIYIRCATYFEANPDNVIVSVIFRGDECTYKN